MVLYISEAVAQVNSDSGDPTPDFGPVTTSMGVWTAYTGGTQKTTGLTDAVGNAITTVTPIAATGYQCVFNTTDGYNGMLFLEDPQGLRHPVFPSDLGNRIVTGTALTSYASQIATLSDYPTSFPPATHTHDDRYYTMSQIDTKLAAVPEILTWNVPGSVAATNDDVVPIYNDGTAARTIIAVRVSVGTAPATTPILVDINIAGTTIFTTQANRPSVAVGQLSSGKKTNMDVTAWPAGAPLAPNIDQVGSATSPGADMIIQVLAL